MLKFPTMAEQALAEWRAATRTISLVTICKRRGAERSAKWPSVIVFRFEDDTALEITGRGQFHKVEVFLP